VAPRAAGPARRGRLIEVALRRQRVSDRPDPLNHSVQLHVHELDHTKADLGLRLIETLDPAVADGLLTVTFTISADLPEADRVLSPGTAYWLPSVVAFGTDTHALALGEIAWRDVTEIRQIAALQAALVQLQKRTLDQLTLDPEGLQELGTTVTATPSWSYAEITAPVAALRVHGALVDPALTTMVLPPAQATTGYTVRVTDPAGREDVATKNLRFAPRHESTVPTV